MNDFTRLQEKLTKLRERERSAGEARIMRAADADNLLSRIVTEFDETILPRRVSFTANDQSLSFAVANRKLQAVLPPLPDDLVSTFGDLSGQAIADADAPELDRMRELITKCLSGKGGVSVRTGRLTGHDFSAETGVLASILARKWEISLEPAEGGVDPEAVMSDFLAAAGNMALAYFKVVDEEVSESGGEEDQLTRLTNHAAELLDAYLQKRELLFPGSPDVRCLVLQSANGDTPAVVLADHGASYAFLSVSADNLGAALQAWQDAAAAAG